MPASQGLAGWSFVFACQKSVTLIVGRLSGFGELVNGDLLHQQPRKRTTHESLGLKRVTGPQTQRAALYQRCDGAHPFGW